MEEKKFIKRKEKALVDGSHDSLAESCHNLGEHYQHLKRYSEAVREYEEEAYIYRVLGRRLKMARAHHKSAEMLLRLSEFSCALDHIDVYLKTASKLKNKFEEQQAYDCLGRTYLMQAQKAVEDKQIETLLKKSETAFIHSLIISKELSDWVTKQEQSEIQVRLLLNISTVKEKMNDFEESVEYIEKAIKISKTNGFNDLLHPCYVSLSLLYQHKKNNVKLALKYCNLAIDVAKRLSDDGVKICETLMLKAEILIKEGNFTAAKQVLLKAHKRNTPDSNDRENIQKALNAVTGICQTLDKLITTRSSDTAKRKRLFDKLGGGIQRLSPIVDRCRKQKEKL